MFGELVFPLIPDHEVRAAKLTNRWISGCWWGRDASSDEHLVGTKFGTCLNADQFVGNLLENSGAAVKRSMLEERNGILILVRTLEYLDRSWNHVETKRCHLLQRSGRLQRRLHLRRNLTATYLKCVDKECMRKRSESDPSGPKLAERLDALHVRLLVLGSHTLENAKRIKMRGKGVATPHGRRRRNGDSMRIQIHDR